MPYLEHYAAPTAAEAARPSGASRPHTLDDFLDGDAQLAATARRALRIVGKDIPLLIEGETGTGKELFARAFHRSGPRFDKPFVAVNCAAIPEGLIESDLFGYEEGAFSGARRRGHVGKLLQAHGGTLFLDEIGDMPLALQARLLRVLQEREVTPLGSSRVLPVDFSLLCATHRALPQAVAAGRFRADLYYRINGVRLALPPLRERSDLVPLVGQLLTDEAGGRAVAVAPAVWQVFSRYHWPGNLRQLHGVLRALYALLEPGEMLQQEHLPEELLEAMPEEEAELSPLAAPLALPAAAHGERLAEVELQLMRRVLADCNGNVSAAARRLGVSRNTLYRRLKPAVR
ncbi:MAG: sigma 54-interacting transcriptional regulator [Pseudogulbenkiania sp.]|nr:sigma 54-interacting transcriptional regulator [Pseudogulbenkiania sp.]